MDMNIWMNRPK